MSQEFLTVIFKDFLDLFCFFFHSTGINPKGILLLTRLILNKLHWCNHLCFCTSSFLGKKILAQIQHSEEGFVADCHCDVIFISEEHSIPFLPTILGFLNAKKCIFKSFSILPLISVIQGFLCWPHHRYRNDHWTAVEYAVCLTTAAGFLIFSSVGKCTQQWIILLLSLKNTYIFVHNLESRLKKCTLLKNGLEPWRFLAPTGFSHTQTRTHLQESSWNFSLLQTSTVSKVWIYQQVSI